MGADFLGGAGILGFAAWLAWSLFAFQVAWRLRRRPGLFPLGTALFCAWLVLQLNGLTQVNFADAKVLHQLMWVMAWGILWLTAGTSEVGEAG